MELGYKQRAILKWIILLDTPFVSIVDGGDTEGVKGNVKINRRSLSVVQYFNIALVITR